jgi:glycosyltransferase involved in cell wall biosynthesis
VTTAPLISVVVPVRNGEHHLEGLLDGLDRQALAADLFETIVVDDHSSDGTAALLERWAAAAPERRRVASASGRGPAHARNAGTALARAPWITFTDGDVVPHPAWLATLADAVAGGDAEAIEGAVEPLPEEALGLGSHTVRNDGGRYVTANMTYGRALLERLGGFDERFEEAFLEDSDLAFRALDAGVEIRFVPEARVYHRVIPTPRLRHLRSTRRMRWLALLGSKHPERYRGQLRPYVRPVTRPDAHVLAGLAGGAGAVVAHGLPRLVALALVANGVRVLVGSGQLRAPARERPGQALLAVALPVWKTAWWLTGCVRFKRFVW